MIFGFHSGRMNKWYFGGWLAEVDNGKDTNFHLHVASMTNNGGIHFLTEQELVLLTEMLPVVAITAAKSTVWWLA